MNRLKIDQVGPRLTDCSFMNFRLSKESPKNLRYSRYGLVAFVLATLHACSSASFSGSSLDSADLDESEQGTKNPPPVDVAGGFGLVCAVTDYHPADVKITDVSCSLLNRERVKFRNTAEMKFEATAKSGTENLAIRYFEPNVPGNFTFSLQATQLENVAIDINVIAILNGSENTREYTADLLSVMAPVEHVLITLDDSTTGPVPGCDQIDCYDNAQSLALGTLRIGPDRATMVLTASESNFAVWVEKGGSRVLNASGLSTHGWQQNVSYNGELNATEFSSFSRIAGRACPAYVYPNYLNKGENRCLFYSGVLGRSDIRQLLNDVSFINAKGEPCAILGMRLPVIYEFSLTKVPALHTDLANLINTSSPSFWNDIFAGDGIPLPNDRTWTATTGAVTTEFLSVGKSPETQSSVFTSNQAIMCVLPANLPGS